MLEDTLMPLTFQTVSEIKRNLLAPHQSSRFNHIKPCFLAVVICILVQVLGSDLSACSCVGNHAHVCTNPLWCKLIIQTAGSRVQQEYSWVFLSLFPLQRRQRCPGSTIYKPLNSSKFWRKWVHAIFTSRQQNHLRSGRSLLQIGSWIWDMGNF